MIRLSCHFSAKAEPMNSDWFLALVRKELGKKVYFSISSLEYEVYLNSTTKLTKQDFSNIGEARYNLDLDNTKVSAAEIQQLIIVGYVIEAPPHLSKGLPIPLYGFTDQPIRIANMTSISNRQRYRKELKDIIRVTMNDVKNHLIKDVAKLVISFLYNKPQSQGYVIKDDIDKKIVSYLADYEELDDFMAYDQRACQYYTLEPNDSKRKFKTSTADCVTLTSYRYKLQSL